MEIMKIYYKPSCITCKKALSELERMKIDLDERDFFKDPLGEAEIKKILKMGKIKASELLRSRDKMYKELKLDKSNHSESQIIKLMAKHPGLIKRPIIISKNKIIIGKTDSKQIKSIQ